MPNEIAIGTIYTLTDKSQLPVGWRGEVGYIDQRMILTRVPDYRAAISIYLALT